MDARFGDKSDTEYERALSECERDGGPIKEISGGVMPITGAGDSQLHYLQSEVQRLTRERDAALEQLREANERIEWLHRQWEFSRGIQDSLIELNQVQKRR